MSDSPPFNINDKIINLISEIMDLVGQTKTYDSIDSQPKLRKQNRIKSVYSSCAIEANSLSLDQVTDIINGKIVLGSKKEIQEVKNAINAYDNIININPFDLNDLKLIHKMLTIYLIDNPGDFRKNEEGVFDGDKCIFIAPPHTIVNELMENLFKWLNSNKDIIHPLILSSVFHYEFLFIHPFKDGNGRTARLIQNALLAKTNPLFYWLPIENSIKDFQKEYYDAIAISHKEGSSTKFIEFILSMIKETLLNLIVDINKYSNNKSIYVIKLLEVMDKDIPLTANEIMFKLNLKSKETLRKNYINPAIESGLIVFEIQDKPTSKNQRYIRVKNYH
ncbi:MAG: Fic family protein [Anaeroplasmataceae bacterium]